MGRPSLPTKSFNIASDELESARYCAKEQGVSLNKYLRLAVLEKNRGVVQGLETRDALDDIRATVRESETRNAMALESLMADLRAEQSAALQANEELVVKTLQAFSQFLAQQEPVALAPTKQPATKAASRGPVANPAFLPPKPY
ncbi:hypothetical protein N5J01_00620 [Stenotrophomonas sp. GD03701]|uniref:Uncharacterized protein n=1 Tax=Stenotrophomonas maltophilia TaxID=40324 RepID=A0AAW3S659_STEMA|nr:MULTISPECIES: hypothetical protein [Stenotrophomonas]MBA0311588.1 hypothetical protein [Stenotrophomonas maltophilia]MBN5061729.1 hypothetical protein [Stenotrophomonas maltophilia]MDH1386907.1 hypothetical protein [Stenotrophomonas sp. GD03701]MDH1391185.1 hypothetical protein [Stenotrophomonas sp. GD03702]